MIKTLISACHKQSIGVTFGPQDIKGSVIALINRGLIASHMVNKKGRNSERWYVTPQAVNMLTDMGIKISC